jgi:hypothetical protein
MLNICASVTFATQTTSAKHNVDTYQQPLTGSQGFFGGSPHDAEPQNLRNLGRALFATHCKAGRLCISLE